MITLRSAYNLKRQFGAAAGLSRNTDVPSQLENLSLGRGETAHHPPHDHVASLDFLTPPSTDIAQIAVGEP